MGLRVFGEVTLAGINAMSATPATHAPAHAAAMGRLPGQPRIRRNPAIRTGIVSASHVTAASAAGRLRLYSSCRRASQISRRRARRVQNRFRGYEKDVATGGSTYTHPQNRQGPGRAPDPVRPRPRPESPDHRPRLPTNIRSRSASGRDGMIHAERLLLISSDRVRVGAPPPRPGRERW
jgi:hypothetical protein